MDVATTEPTASTAEDISFAYVPKPGLLQITIVSFLLGLVTLGIYRFWAKTNVRKHIWSCVHLNGTPLEYTGKGMELFMGFLVVLLVLVLPFTAILSVVAITQGPNSPWLVVLQLMLGLLIYVFWGFALYRARRYQLSRTTWRGIRGALVGSAIQYSLLFFGSLMAKGASLGWATPVMNTVLQEHITNDMRFGDAAFKFKGRAGPLYPAYALSWLLSLFGIIATIAVIVGIVAAMPETTSADTETAGYVLTVFALAFVGMVVFSGLLAVLWSLYLAKQMRTFASYTRFDGAQFEMDVSTFDVVWLVVGNLLLILLTFGIAWPYVNQRLVRFLVDRLSLHGKVDIDRIRQSQAPLDKRGEGLADAFDIGGL